MANTYFIVGNEYSAFSVASNVVTACEFLDRLERGETFNDDQIVFGLGINESQRSSIARKLAAGSTANILHYIQPASCELTHKLSTQNNLISEPRKLGNGRYEFDLILFDHKDRLSDHVTGQHVGAMIQLEAARQAAIAATELEYSETCGFDISIVVEKFTSLFHGYMFPLPVTLLATLDETARSDNRISVTCPVTLSQAGTVISKMYLEGGVLPRNFLQIVEMRQARRAVAAATKHHAPTSSVTPDPVLEHCTA